MDNATNSTEMSTNVYSEYSTPFLDYYDNDDKPSPDKSSYTTAIFYSVVFAFGLCANILVLIIIYLFEKLTTVTNLLLLNLVLSSLLFIISVPFVAVYSVLSHWPFGLSMCKLVGSLYFLGFFSSVLFLALMTFDRYLAVVYPISAGRVRTRAYAVVSCAAVWVISAVACIKPMITRTLLIHLVEERTYCEEDPRKFNDLLWAVGFYTQLLLFFLFPLLLIVYCYSHIAFTVLSSQIGTKFKTVRLIFVIVLLFFICWTPFNIATLKHELASTPETRFYWKPVISVTQNFAHLYFCISPIFYTFVGKKFQNYFLVLLLKRFPRLKKHISVSHSAGNIPRSIHPSFSAHPGPGHGGSTLGRELQTSLSTRTSFSSSGGVLGCSHASLHVDPK